MNKIIFLFFTSLSLRASEIQNDVYFVALAGGGGERLWPLSKREQPKQFLSLNGKQTLLEDTLDLFRTTQIEHAHFWTVTTKELAQKIQSLENVCFEKIVIEPERRDTAPAILLACLHIFQQNPEATVFFAPTDHYIPDKNIFALCMRKAIKHAICSDDIILLGIKPTYPATQYGYICYEPNNTKNGISRLTGFYEKPEKKLAYKYLKSGKTLWNAGVFCAKVKTFIEAYKTFAPDIYEITLDFFLRGQKKYNENPKQSIDYAILEKYPQRAVIYTDAQWSDVGDLKTFLSLKSDVNNDLVVSLDSKNNFVTNKKLVALVGVENLCVVETDKEILIVDCRHVQEIRKLVEMLKKNRNLSSFT